jgi:hypothetical protein
MAFVNDDVEELWQPIRRKFGARLNKRLELALDSLKIFIIDFILKISIPTFGSIPSLSPSRMITMVEGGFPRLVLTWLKVHAILRIRNSSSSTSCLHGW